MSEKPSEAAIQKMRKFVEKYCEKSGTTTHPDHEVTEVVILGLASHHETLGKPLCPCRFYPDKAEEIKHRTWICACDDMQIYKYCHCLLFVNSEGSPLPNTFPKTTRAGAPMEWWPTRPPIKDSPCVQRRLNARASLKVAVAERVTEIPTRLRQAEAEPGAGGQRARSLR